MYNQDLPPNKVSFIRASTVGTSYRPGLGSNENVPGAGTYEKPSTIQEGPKFSMRAKVKELKP